MGQAHELKISYEGFRRLAISFYYNEFLARGLHPESSAVIAKAHEARELSFQKLRLCKCLNRLSKDVPQTKLIDHFGDRIVISFWNKSKTKNEQILEVKVETIRKPLRSDDSSDLICENLFLD